MAIREKYLIKEVNDSNELILEPNADESIKVTAVEIPGKKDYECATIKINNSVVGYFTIGYYDMFFLQHANVPFCFYNILNYFKRLGIFSGYPVPCGSKFVVQTPTNNELMKVTYETYDKDDIKSTDPFGVDDNKMLVQVIGTCDDTIESSGWYKLNKNLLPIEYPDFPFSTDVCPSNRILTIYSMNFNTYSKTDNAGKQSRTVRTRITLNNKKIYNRDENGFYTRGYIYDDEGNVISFVLDDIGYEYDNTLGYYNFFTLPEPLVLKGGDEFVAETYVFHGGVDIDPRKFFLNLIGVWEKIK